MHTTNTESPLSQRVLATFVSPRRLFERFGSAPPWFGVLAISTAVAILAAALLPEETFLDQMSDPVDRRGRPVEITSSPAEIARWGRYLAMLAALVGHPIIAFAVAGLCILLFGILGGFRASYRGYLAVVAHALLIPAAGTLLFLLVAAVPGTGDALSALRDPEPSAGLLRHLVAGLDPFQLWGLAVVGIGIAALDGRRSALLPTSVLIGLYLLIDVVTAMLIS